MFALEDLKILIKEELVGLEILVCGYLSLGVVGSVYKMVQHDLSATSLPFVLPFKDIVDDWLGTKAWPQNHLKFMEH